MKRRSLWLPGALLAVWSCALLTPVAASAAIIEFYTYCVTPPTGVGDVYRYGYYHLTVDTVLNTGTAVQLNTAGTRAQSLDRNVDGVIYGAMPNTSNGSIFAVDPVTGVASLSALFTRPRGLSFDPAGGMWNSEGFIGLELQERDPNYISYNYAPIGAAVTMAGVANNIEWSDAGVLYGSRNGGATDVFTINPVTGAFTDFSSAGGSTTMGDLDYYAGTGMLYGLRNNRIIIEINPTTGAQRDVVTFTDFPGLSFSGLVSIPEPASLALLLPGAALCLRRPRLRSRTP